MHKQAERTGTLVLTRGFFLNMGGIALHKTNVPERVWPTGYNRVSSADSYLYLLGKRYGDVLLDFSQISKEAI